MPVKHIELPHLGESVTEASISMWLVKEGDRVEKYDPVAEAVSDKVTTEIPSNYSGVVKEMLVELDRDHPIGTPILAIETKEGELEETETEAQPPEPKTESNRARYSPAVVRIAQERGIDLQQVEGTGRGGRITRKDVLNFDIDSARKQTETAPVEQPEAEEEPAAKAAPDTEHTNRVPADGIRKAIAKKMVQSTTEIPHAWMMVEADVTNIVQLRNKMKEAFKQQEGVSLSYFPFFIQAVVHALKKHPVLNASWDNGTIVYHQDIHLSIAVASGDHLFVPVIHHADRYSLVGLAKELNRLKMSAQSGTLTAEDMQGGTFTLNNTGVFGSVQSMGIINSPQAAILQVEAIRKQLVPTEDGGFKPADMVSLCLSIDHRLIDGMQAGRFLEEVKKNLARITTVY